MGMKKLSKSNTTIDFAAIQKKNKNNFDEFETKMQKN